MYVEWLLVETGKSTVLFRMIFKVNQGLSVWHFSYEEPMIRFFIKNRVVSLNFGWKSLSTFGTKCRIGWYPTTFGENHLVHLVLSAGGGWCHPKMCENQIVGIVSGTNCMPPPCSSLGKKNLPLWGSREENPSPFLLRRSRENRFVPLRGRIFCS